VSFRYAGHAVFVVLLCVLVTCAFPAPGMASAGNHVLKSMRNQRGVSLLQADTQTVGVDLPDFALAGFGSAGSPREISPSPAPCALDSVPLCRVLRC